MSDIRLYNTVNTSSRIAIPMHKVSHVIEHNNPHHTDKEGNVSSTCWIHFESGKSVHVDMHFEDVMDHLESVSPLSRNTSS